VGDGDGGGRKVVFVFGSELCLYLLRVVFKGVAECGKETNTRFFFFRAPVDTPPPSTFLIWYVFPILMFSRMFSIIFYVNSLLLSTVLCRISFAARACPVTRHELIIHACGVKL